MELPAIVLPSIQLPFDVPFLIHPAIVHFMIVLPIVVLLVELTNLVMKKKTLSVLALLLIVWIAVMAIGAYLTGLFDAKEAYSGLAEATKVALGEHRKLGTYILLGSGVVLFFKLFSMLLSNNFLKAFYLLILMTFIAGSLTQGKEGGELVYKYGINVTPQKSLEKADDAFFDEEDDEEDEEESVPKEVIVQEVKETTPTEEVAPLKIEDNISVTEGMPEESELPTIATH
jgi:uncharacterized membrane protein